MEAIEEEEAGKMFYIHALVRKEEDEGQEGEDPAWCLTQQGKPSTSEEEGEANRMELPGSKRKAKRRRLTAGETDQEGVRRDAWLRELLSSSTDEEDVREAKRGKQGEEDHMRFEESGRWMAEADPTSGVEAGGRASGDTDGGQEEEEESTG
jgi:hypothetical protein